MVRGGGREGTREGQAYRGRSGLVRREKERGR